MRIVTVSSFGAEVYLGSREGYFGREITEAELIKTIGAFQHADVPRGCVARVTRTIFVWDHYAEPGWQIGLINYPNAHYHKEQLWDFAKRLAQHLTTTLNQNRVSVVLHSGHETETIMYEKSDAEPGYLPYPAQGI